LDKLKSINITKVSVSFILAFIIFYGFDGELGLFIRPGYIIFTIIAAIVALVCIVFSICSDIKHKVIQKHVSVTSVVSGLLVMAVTVSMIIFSPSPLKGNYGFSGNISSRSDFGNVENKNVGSFSIKDWSEVIESSQNEKYLDKKVDLTGYVVPIDNDYFYLSRYVIYCCTVDAQLSQVPVYMPNWKKKLSSKDWIEINGQFVTNNDSLEHPVILSTNRLQKISEPRTPYVYGF
jgi:putative membrane protein